MSGPPEPHGRFWPGTLPDSVSYSLNGVDITGSRDGELAVSPSPAAVDQFTVQHSFLTPNQGASPAVVNIVTKKRGATNSMAKSSSFCGTAT